MVDTVYLESKLVENQRAASVLTRYPKADRVLVDHYGEVFNATRQNFRIQKKNPSLVLAEKLGKRVLPTPAQYETGGGAHYYFSHMLNCVYDCRYCFLQGMLRSANYLLFVNYEDFYRDIKAIAIEHKDDQKPVWFFSGYDCDSLAYEPVTKFAEFFVPKFKELSNAVLELRTKSTQIRSLLEIEPQNNVVVAYSLSPERVSKEVEKGAPSLKKRVESMQKLQRAGWRVGLRFDPIIWHADYQSDYTAAIDLVFSELDPTQIDSVTLGGFRLPKDFYKTMLRLYPEHWLFSSGLSESDGMVIYRESIENEVIEYVRTLCRAYMPNDSIYTYPSYGS